MSGEATRAVWERSEQAGGALLVLLALARRMDATGAVEGVRMAEIALEARLSERAARYAVGGLLASGELCGVRASGRGRAGSFRLSGRILPPSSEKGAKFDALSLPPLGEKAADFAPIEAGKAADIAPPTPVTPVSGTPVPPETGVTKPPATQGGRVAARAAPKPGTPGNRYAEFIDAYGALCASAGIEARIRGQPNRNGQAVRDSPYSPVQLAEAALAFEQGEWADDYLARTGGKLHDLVHSAAAYLERDKWSRSNGATRGGTQSHARVGGLAPPSAFAGINRG